MKKTGIYAFFGCVTALFMVFFLLSASAFADEAEKNDNAVASKTVVSGNSASENTNDSKNAVSSEESPEDARKKTAQAGPPENGESGGETVNSRPQDSEAPDQPEFPGIIRKLIRHSEADKPSVYFYYPETGQAATDEALKTFADSAVASFEKNAEDAGENQENLELIGTYSVSRPNPDIISILFNIFDYLGGAHGNLTLVSLNFDLRTGRPLEFRDLFRDPQMAIDIMSELSAQKLTETLGEDAEEDMIKGGTAPEEANFNVLALTPQGVVIEFQPYQVGPWSIGVQEVPLALSQLEPAGPSDLVWPKTPSTGH